MTFYIYTLGCKVNQYESEYMAKLLENSGFVRVFECSADIIIINSCTVTGTGDNKVLKYLRRMRRENPDSIIVLCGCMTQAFPDMASELKQADIILGNYSRKLILSSITEFIATHNRIVNIQAHELKQGEAFEEMCICDFEERSRAFVKIEDGCNRFCSYCIIPYARGRVRSKPLKELKLEIEGLARNGYREIVLVGINLSCYGQDISSDLYKAVECVCSIDGIERVRLGSIEPERMDIDMLKKLSLQKKFCPQFHLSLQSGSDSVLKRMNRHYTSDEYYQIVCNIRKTFKNSAITTDIMTGFPGETEEEHLENLRFAKKVGFARVHVFPYSRRKGTAADKMPIHLENSVKNERARELIRCTDKTRHEFLLSQIGLTETVLTERRKQSGEYEGYTMNYTPVRFLSDDELTGKTVSVKITGVSDDYCIGELI